MIKIKYNYEDIGRYLYCDLVPVSDFMTYLKKDLTGKGNKKKCQLYFTFEDLKMFPRSVRIYRLS